MYKHILLAADFTDFNDKTAQKAVEMAKLSGAKLSLVHAVEPLTAYAYAYSGAVEIEETMVTESKQQMAELGDGINVPVSDQHVIEGPTKQAILQVANEIGADLIVIGSHGRHGLAHLLGSTANAVLHSAKMDVLVVRYDD